MDPRIDSPEAMIGILGEEDRRAASGFVELAGSLGCKYKIRYATAHKTWKCVYEKPKPKRVLFTLECDENRWHVKANLHHMAQYMQAVEACPESIRSRIRDAYDCRMCTLRCKGGPEFDLEGKHYKKCVGCSFYFRGLDPEDWERLGTLIRNEWAAAE